MVNQTDSLDSSWVNLGTEENQEIAKDRRYSGDSGIEEKEEFEVLDGKNQKIQANLCDTPSEDLSLENAILTNFPDGCDRSFTVESKDEDSEERRPYVLGSNKSEIAGFSQEKLLEIIDFVKIGYYVCDLNYNNGRFSELESRGYKVPGQLRKEGYTVVQFYNMNDGKQYRHAGYVFIKDKEITITYRGSRNGFDYRKDAEMILTSSDELLPKGGKIHSGFYSLFKDSWSSVYEILKGHANDQQLEIKDFKINLTGHSMGGAIANIAALCLSVTEGAEDLHVATFASPRVFDSSAAEIYKERLGKKTIRVVNQSDFIPSLPFGSMGYKHVGEQLVITSYCSLQRAHLLDTYRNLIANIGPDQFKSDNSVSIYYYPSYLATVLYNVFTAPSYLILNIHSNDDEQYFKQVKNKHKSASLSEMMKYSGSNNEQKVVIYEDSEPSENGFITFHILRNAIGEKNLLMIPPTFNPNIEHRITSSLIDNLFAMMPSLHRYGRSKGLKVNLLDTAFFVNDDYYLSGDTISLRLLKTLVDNYPGNLALENANSQRVEDNVLALTKESDIISGMGQKPVRNKSMKSGFMNPIDNYPKPQFDNKIPSTIQIDEVEVGSTITNDQSTSIINSNNTDNVQQESTIVAKESEELAAEISQGTSVEDGVTKNDNVQGASTTTTSSDGEDKLPPVQQAIPIVQEELAAQTPPVTLIEDDVAIVSQASTSNDQITPQQESVVLSIGNSTSRALCVATSDAQQVVPRGGTVGTIEALKNLPNNRTIKIFLLNNVQSVAQIFKKSDREAELSLPNGNTYELDLHLINEESLKVLFNKENSVLANAINDFSTVKVPILEQKSGRNEQAPIQLAGHVIREDPIQVVQPKSLVNIRDNNVQLVNESDQPIQGDNGIALMDQSEDDEHFYDAVESQDTNSEEAQVNNTQRSSEHSSGPEQTLEILNEHHSNITANINDEGVGTTINDQSTSIISSDGEDKQTPVQQATPIVQEELAADDVATQESILQTKNLDESDQLIQEDNGIALMDDSYDAVESQDTNSEEAQVNSTKGSGKYSSGSEQTLEIFNRHHSNITAGTDDGSDEEFMATTANIGDESNQPIPNTASEGDFTLESNSSLQDTQPKTLATTVPVNDTQDNTDQPTSDSEKNDTTSQNTKRSKLTVIAVSTLAITGVATGIAIAVYLEMLAVGIAFGACCLVAAAIIYYCNKPSKSLESSNAERVTSEEIKTSYCI